MAVTVSGTQVTFNDSSVQTTAFLGVPANLAVGSSVIMYNFTNSQIIPGDTPTTASIGYPTSTGNSFTMFSVTFRAGNQTTPGPSNSAGYPNTTAPSGTWRAISQAKERFFNGCETVAGSFIAVRIA